MMLLTKFLELTEVISDVAPYSKVSDKVAAVAADGRCVALLAVCPRLSL